MFELIAKLDTTTARAAIAASTRDIPDPPWSFSSERGDGEDLGAGRSEKQRRAPERVRDQRDGHIRARTPGWAGQLGPREDQKRQNGGQARGEWRDRAPLRPAGLELLQ